MDINALCMLCGSNRAKEIYRKEMQNNVWRLLKCSGCGLVSLSPCLSTEQVAKLYANQSYHADLINQDLDVSSSMERASEQVKIIQSFASQGKILDIGCSTGLFLSHAKEYGYTGVGVEINPYTSNYAREQLELDVFTGTLNEVQLESQSFDIVTLWDVLEHELYPKKLLNQIHQLLTPNGFLFISCPNIDGLFPKITHTLIYKTFRFWEFPLIPHHLYEFTPNSLELLLNNTGFRLISTISISIPRDFYLNSWNPLQNQSLKLRFLKLGTSLVYRLLFSVIYPLADLLKKGNAFIAVAKKKV